MIRYVTHLVQLSCLLGIFLPGFAIQAEDTINLKAAGLLKPEFIRDHASDLGISSDQGDKLIATYQAAKDEATPLEEKVKEARNALESALQATSVNETEAQEKLTALLNAEAVLKQLHLRTLLRLRANLTPDQLSKARDLQSGAVASETLTPEVEARLKEKAEKLKGLITAQIGGATEGMERAGNRIKDMIVSGKVSEGEKEIDRLIALFSGPAPTIDYSSFDPGDLDNLKDRHAEVHEKAVDVEDLDLIRQLGVARDALLDAKEDGDAKAMGRILSWAESKLNKKSETTPKN